MRSNSGCFILIVVGLLLLYLLGSYAIFLFPLLVFVLPFFFKGRRVNARNEEAYRQRGGSVDSARPLLILFAAIMKADGHIMRTELVYVSEALKRLYPLEIVPALIDELKEILHQNLSIEEACWTLRQQHTGQSLLTIIYMLVGLAEADGVVDSQERYLLYEIAARLGVERMYVDAFLHGNRSYSYTGQGREEGYHQQGGYGYSGGARRRSAFTGKDPYTVLGVEPTASDAQVKSAYRKLVNIWHPDRFQNKSQAEIDTATEKFKEIQAAYEEILKARA